jgi:hypothetical protein
MLMGLSLLNAGRPSTRSSYRTYGGQAMGVAFLKSSYVSGFKRICVYDRMGSQYVVTIGASELCPLSQ